MDIDHVFSNEDALQLSANFFFFEKHAPDVITRLYNMLENEPSLHDMIRPRRDHLEFGMRGFFLSLCDATLAYEKQTMKHIGKIHVDLGIPIQWVAKTFHFIIQEVFIRMTLEDRDIFFPLFLKRMQLREVIMYEVYQKNYDIKEEKVREEIVHYVTTHFLQVMIQMAEWNDPMIDPHVDHVKLYSRKIAQIAKEEYDLADQDITWLSEAAIAHDIGKIIISKDILTKADILTPDERSAMQTHARAGRYILSQIMPIIASSPYSIEKFMRYAMEEAEFHHEWWNGAGYPHGLQGIQIPLCARIVSLADVMDALDTEKLYRKRMSSEEIRHFICTHRGTQFDPTLVDLVIDRWNYFFPLCSDQE